MNTFDLKLSEIDLSLWNQLPVVCQGLLASKILHSFLNGELYPTGTNQLDLAIELAENGSDEVVISKLTRLNKEVFQGFLPTKS